MNTAELCVNLWYAVDKKTGFINAIAGRGYFLQGSDEQKTETLKILSATDYLIAQWMPIPDRYNAVIVNTESGDKSEFSGFVHASDLDIHGLALFESVFSGIEEMRQDYIPIRDTVTIKIPDEPLFVMTAIERGPGNQLKAIFPRP